MDNIVQIQMKRDNLAVNNTKIQSIDDILSKHKNINNAQNNSNLQNKIENNEITHKENKEEQKKKNTKDIFIIIIHVFFSIVISFDFINYLMSPHVRKIFII